MDSTAKINTCAESVEVVTEFRDNQVGNALDLRKERRAIDTLFGKFHKKLFH